jgi:glycosyltransferase involved in cell wall biosynthesis
MITVVIPTRNRAMYLRQSIASVLEQTFTDLTLVISDNASTDSTPEVVSQFDDPRLEYVRLPENIGLLGNFNRTLEDIRTPYVLQLADDEILYPTHLEKCLQALESHAHAGIVHTAFDVIGPSGEPVFFDMDWRGADAGTDTVVEPGHAFVRESLLSWHRVHASTTLIRTSALPDVKFDPEDWPPVDFALWLRLALDWDIAFIPEPLAAWRIHPNSHSASVGQYTPTGYIDSADYYLVGETVKLRFLERYAHQIDDASELEAQIRRWTGYVLVNRVGRLTLPQRKRGHTARLLLQAIRMKPQVALRSDAWRLMVASMLGPRLVDRVKRAVRGAEPAAPPVAAPDDGSSAAR